MTKRGFKGNKARFKGNKGWFEDNKVGFKVAIGGVEGEEVVISGRLIV